MARILVADDEPGVRELLRFALENKGHEVVESSTGSDTFLRLAEGGVDLLILDIMLPGMDGYTLQLKLAHDEKRRTLPVIVLTALETARPLFSKFPQVKAFFSKPFDPGEISRTIEQILSSSR